MEIAEVPSGDRSKSWSLDLSLGLENCKVPGVLSTWSETPAPQQSLTYRAQLQKGGRTGNELSALLSLGASYQFQRQQLLSMPMEKSIHTQRFAFYLPASHF